MRTIHNGSEQAHVMFQFETRMSVPIDKEINYTVLAEFKQINNSESFFAKFKLFYGIFLKCTVGGSFQTPYYW